MVVALLQSLGGLWGLNLGLRSRCSLQPRLSHYGLSGLEKVRESVTKVKRLQCYKGMRRGIALQG